MAAPHRIHCAYHKCLTVYAKRVFDGLFNRCQPWGRGYRHFNSDLPAFLGAYRGLAVASVNNHALDLEALGDVRVTRFLRDPRDLVVSGYHYHRRGAEPWTEIQDPTPSDWEFANGCLPDGLQGSGRSFAALLQELPEEEGLLAELQFRRRHFESMARWPREHARVRTFRYEEILGNEVAVFRDLFAFYELPWPQRRLGAWFARRHALPSAARAQPAPDPGASAGGKDPHVRDPKAGQWRALFTPRVRRAFDAEYAGLVRDLGYPES